MSFQMLQVLRQYVGRNRGAAGLEVEPSFRADDPVEIRQKGIECCLAITGEIRCGETVPFRPGFDPVLHVEPPGRTGLIPTEGGVMGRAAKDDDPVDSAVR